MKKADYQAWLGMEITKEVFARVRERQADQNADFVMGMLRSDNNDISMKYYDQLVGYNKAIHDMQNLEYEYLMGDTLAEESTEENEENDETNTVSR